METSGSHEEPEKPKKRALVMPGGGGRGAYQVGVVKALLESGLKFDMAFGTSIGAINATFLAQGELRRLEEMWCNLRPWDVFKLPDAHQLGRMVLGRKLGMLDTRPLEDLLRRESDLKRIKESSMKVRLVTTDLCSLETRMINLEEVRTTSELIDLLMATSAVPIAFPPRQLHGEGLWVDGGLVRNTPLRAAIDSGADEIFMVLLHPEEVKACPSNMWQLIARCLDVVLDASARKELELAQLYNRLIKEGAAEAAGMRAVKLEVIQPNRAVDINLLEIDPERSRSLIRQGYEDARLHLQNIERKKMAASVEG
ncbi:MAG TPA: patatin-like phospholipase family protein [Candidatus Melainabacteria bacterium]|nr:patatin-like phospholipase family protein [Candidatus Melainabacteria bacterium]